MHADDIRIRVCVWKFENRATAFRSLVTSGCDDWLGGRDSNRKTSGLHRRSCEPTLLLPRSR